MSSADNVFGAESAPLHPARYRNPEDLILVDGPGGVLNLAGYRDWCI